MLIVVEGPEKSGKTTLIGDLIRLWKGDAVRMYHPAAANNLKRYEQDLEFVRTHPDWLVLYDRWYPSDFVYRGFDRKPMGVNWSLSQLEREYGSQADLKLYCDTPGDVLFARRKRENDDSDFPCDPYEEWAEYRNVCDIDGGWYWLTMGDRTKEKLPVKLDLILKDRQRDWRW